MKVLFSNRQKDLSLGKIKQPVTLLLTKIISQEGKSPDMWDELHLYFVTKKTIQELHAHHFQDPTSTDCITFPIDTDTGPRPDALGPLVLGEIFICPKVAIEYATLHKIDPYTETIRYIVHGLLHLLGYDDIQPKERKIMRQKEAHYLKLIHHV